MAELDGKWYGTPEHQYATFSLCECKIKQDGGLFKAELQGSPAYSNVGVFPTEKDARLAAVKRMISSLEKGLADAQAELVRLETPERLGASHTPKQMPWPEDSCNH